MSGLCIIFAGIIIIAFIAAAYQVAWDRKYPTDRNTVEPLRDGSYAFTYQGGHKIYRMDGLGLNGEVRLFEPVRTPLGSRVQIVCPLINLDYYVDNGCITVVKVWVAGGKVVSRRGESFQLPFEAERYLNETLLPSAVYDLIAKDDHVRGMMLRKARAFAASEKQKAFARRLHIAFTDDIGSKEISKLIDQKLLESRSKRNRRTGERK